MRSLLHGDYRLRGWKGAPFYLEYFPTRTLRRLRPAEFAFLVKCDGQTELEPDAWPPEPEWARAEGVIVPCGAGGALLPEQEYRLYPNRFLHYLELSVTGRCNFHCKHCFNAPGAEPRTVEPGFEQLVALLDELDRCGVGRLRLDGGEPLVRRDFLALTAEMAKRGILAYEIITNGSRITPSLLDALESQGHRPKWYVSFDGLGHHDWLRGVPGAEERVLENIRLMCERGYYVHVHQCVWRDSVDSVRPTALKLKELGVSRLRLTTVEPSVRWMQLCPEQTISIEEWQARIPDFLDWWYGNSLNMDLDVWSYWVHNRGSKFAMIVPDLRSRASSDDAPACVHALQRPFIDADGRLLPCIASSGLAAAMGIEWGNVYRDSLQELYTQSPFLDQLSRTCGQIKDSSPHCQSCRWKPICSAGCRAEALVQGNSLTGVDERVCSFFESGCYEKLLAAAGKWGLKTTA